MVISKLVTGCRCQAPSTVRKKISPQTCGGQGLVVTFKPWKKCDISVTQSFCDNGLLWLKDYTKTVKCGAEIGQRIVFCSVHIRPLVSRAPSKPRKEMEPTGSHQSLSASSTCLKNDTGIPSHLFKEKRTDRCQWPQPHPLFLNSRALHS